MFSSSPACEWKFRTLVVGDEEIQECDPKSQTQKPNGLTPE